MMRRTGPDSLMGWFVALMICLISTMMYGTAGLSSMLFVACITRYDTDRNKAAFPFILSYVIQATTGPFGGYFARKFGVRAVVLVGSVLAFAGIGACFLAESILTVTVLWGIVFGTGFGFSTLLLPAIINDYFFKHRSKALGMSYLGSPIGFFVFPPIFEILYNEYGLSGTFLFLSAINMHCIPLSLLLRQPNFKDDNPKLPEEIKRVANLSRNNSRLNNQKHWFVYENPVMKKEKIKNGTSHRRCSIEFLWNNPISQEFSNENNRQHVLMLNKNSHSIKSPNKKARSYENISCNIYENLDSTDLKTQQYFVPSFLLRENNTDDLVSKINKSISRHLESDERVDEFNDYSLKKFNGFNNTETRIAPVKYSVNAPEIFDDLKEIKNDGNCEISSLNERNDLKEFSVIYFGTDRKIESDSCCNYDLKSHSNFMVKSDVEMGETYVNKGFSYSLEEISYSNLISGTGFKVSSALQEARTDQNKSLEEHNKGLSKNRSLVRMYCSPIFILLAVVNAIFNLQFNTLTTVIIDFSRDHDIDFSYEKFIMMCLSVMGTCGLLGFGWVTDGGYMTRNRFASLCQFVTSISTALLPLTVGFKTLIATLAVWCVFQSCFVLLLPAIVAEYFEDDIQAVAVSAVNVLCGPLYLIIPPLIGYFRDGLGTYNDIFYLLSGLSLLNSIAVFVVPYVARWKQKPCKS